MRPLNCTCLIVIPAFNESTFLPDMLFEIGKVFPLDQVLVIDDGSSDDTAKMAQRYPVRLVRHTKNRGKGACLKRALAYARQLKIDWLITLDADGQHKPAFLPLFFSQIESGYFDLVIGNRADRRSNMPVIRILSNGLASVLVSICGGFVRYRDSQCGFRAMRVRAFDPDHFEEDGFQFESEVLMRAGRQKLRSVSIPISTEYHAEKSSIRHVRDTIKFLMLVFKSFFW